MCGICGYNGISDSAILQPMSAAIAHRGPDDNGMVFFPPGVSGTSVGLAHRRLSIIDLSPAGHQPMSNSDGTVWITYNGEIYNFYELRKELEKKGYIFQSNSDTEVLIYLYENEGHECLKRLNGIFAFAILDVKKRELFLARDGLGVKPLYYAKNDQGFFFASELKALLKVPGIDRQGGIRKGLCKKALGELLPQEVLNRHEKQGFSFPLRIWGQEQVRDQLTFDVFSDKSLGGRLNPETMTLLAADTTPFKNNVLWRWGLHILFRWCKNFRAY